MLMLFTTIIILFYVTIYASTYSRTDATHAPEDSYRDYAGNIWWRVPNGFITERWGSYQGVYHLCYRWKWKHLLYESGNYFIIFFFIFLDYLLYRTLDYDLLCSYLFEFSYCPFLFYSYFSDFFRTFFWHFFPTEYNIWSRVNRKAIRYRNRIMYG